MEKFRIGNDLSVFWAIEDDRNQPYPLAGKRVRIYLTHPRGRMELTEDVSIQGNVICWFFRGVKQRYLGAYTLSVEIYSDPTTRVLRRDIMDAFSLVPYSQYENKEEKNLDVNETGQLTLSSVLEVYQIMPIVPQIGENGNWWVDGVDTGKPSRGEKGEDGKDGEGGGSIDPELLEGYLPMMREFSDDFNNDFSR